MLSEFHKKKQKLLEIYNKKELIYLFPIERVGEENLDIKAHEERKKNLENEIFYLSFVGQIKAGKSTLINSLIFGENVLPVDDTPHTAKITIIKYADKPYFLGNFYSDSEWKTLKSTKFKDNDGKEKNYFDEFLREDINASISKGIYEKEIINASPKREDKLELLKEYVAKNGKYTPFIKNIELYYPSELIKEIILVDTPGTNDPNEFRSKMTEEWIHNSDAVIYVSYAGRSIDSIDLDFMDKYLSAVDPNKRIIAINKIDTLTGGTSELMLWINSLKSDPDFSRRIFNDKSVFVYVSSLAALIQSLKDANKPLDENLSWHASELKDYLSFEKNGLNELKIQIEDKIVKNKAQGILDSHKNYFLETVLENKNKFFKNQEETIKNNINMLTLDKNKLEEEKKKYQDLQNNLTNKFKEKTDKTGLELKKISYSLENDILKTVEKIREDIKNQLNSIGRVKNLSNEAYWIIFNTINIHLHDIKKNGVALTKKIKDLIDNLMDELKSEIGGTKGILKNTFVTLFQQYSFATVNNISSMIDNKFSQTNLTEIIKDSTSWWGRTLNTQNAKTDAISGIMHEIDKLINDFFVKNLSSQILTEIKEYFDKIIQELEKSINNKFEEFKAQINNILKESANKDSMVKENIRNLDEIKNKMLYIENLKNQLIKEIANE